MRRRLTTVSGATSASFVYDGDGNRVNSVLNGVPTYSSAPTSSGPATIREQARLAGSQRGTLTGGHPPASTNGGSGKIAALCYHPA